MTELWGNSGKILADHSSYSRKRLEPAIRAKVDDMDENNKSFIRRMWDHHPRIMRHHEEAGRQVVRL